MLANLKNFVKTYRDDIILFIIVFLTALLIFALVYILVKKQDKEPIKIEQGNTNLQMTSKYPYPNTDIRKFNFADL